MADVHDKATRSKNMRAIATRDTAIEKRLAGLLSAQGITFHTQDATLPGKPDFVVNDYDCVIFYSRLLLASSPLLSVQSAGHANGFLAGKNR
ncbi:very short patch repair protein [Salmonella enterica subsp. enterica serovar Meleagridis]|nr:very short patch repair protein [Salmonella enterica subsp. enterica serovar Meleagridis str. 0047]